MISAPNYPGRITPQPGQLSLYQFNLGSLSEGMFEPSNLVCTVKSVGYSIPKNTISNGENKCNF